jgi:hypothetical protein
MINTRDNKTKKFDWRKISPRKFLKIVSLIVGALFLVFVLSFVFFPDLIINTFVKNKITKLFTESYPEYSLRLGGMHYSIWNNRLECDSIRLEAKDSTLTCRLDSFSISGISWMKMIAQSGFDPNIISSSIIGAQNIIFGFNKSQEELRIGMLHISFPDSEMVTDSIRYHPLINDEQFFAKSQFRQTRFCLDISQIKVIGFDFLSYLERDTYRAGKIILKDVFADILLNKDKPSDENLVNPNMPNEIFSSMKEIISIDSLQIINGQLKYYERFAVNAPPGVITFSKFKISVSRIANHTEKPETTMIRGDGLFMNSTAMKIFMAIPLTSKDYSLKYSGSLGRMNVSDLNVFLEPVENRIIKSGVIQSANFNVHVNSGRGSGNLRVAYDDLGIAISNKKIGYDLGLVNRISNFIGDMFIIRTTNLPDENGSMKIGEINYTRDPGHYFFQYLWFSLRSGIGDVVGF